MRKQNLLAKRALCPMTLSLLSVVLIVGMSAVAHADSLKLAYTPGADGFSYGDGGEFGAYDLSAGFPYAAPMPSVAKVAGYDFQTFCVQSQVTFNPGTLYITAEGLVDSQGTQLTKAAAFLFDAFWNGTLNNFNGFSYDYTMTNTTPPNARQQSAGAVQWALWHFQGKPAAFAEPAGAQDIIDYLDNLYGSDANAKAAYDGSSFASGKAVRILQLSDGSGTFHQAQLVEVVPLPQAATAGLALLGLIAGTSVLRRKPKFE